MFSRQLWNRRSAVKRIDCTFQTRALSSVCLPESQRSWHELVLRESRANSNRHYTNISKESKVSVADSSTCCHHVTVEPKWKRPSSHRVWNCSSSHTGSTGYAEATPQLSWTKTHPPVSSLQLSRITHTQGHLNASMSSSRPHKIIRIHQSPRVE